MLQICNMRDLAKSYIAKLESIQIYFTVALDKWAQTVTEIGGNQNQR